MICTFSFDSPGVVYRKKMYDTIEGVREEINNGKKGDRKLGDFK